MDANTQQVKAGFIRYQVGRVATAIASPVSARLRKLAGEPVLSVRDLLEMRRSLCSPYPDAPVGTTPAEMTELWITNFTSSGQSQGWETALGRLMYMTWACMALGGGFVLLAFTLAALRITSLYGSISCLVILVCITPPLVMLGIETAKKFFQEPFYDFVQHMPWSSRLTCAVLNLSDSHLEQEMSALLPLLDERAAGKVLQMSRPTDTVSAIRLTERLERIYNEMVKPVSKVRRIALWLHISRTAWEAGDGHIRLDGEESELVQRLTNTLGRR